MLPSPVMELTIYKAILQAGHIVGGKERDQSFGIFLVSLGYWGVLVPLPHQVSA